MGLFGKLFGGGVDKNSLIKELAKARVKSDPMAAAMGFDENMVNTLSGIQLTSLPEGTIVAIVETWASLNKSGVANDDAFLRIEKHRARFMGKGELPNPLTLSSYIKYRIDVENQTGAPISDDFIETAIEYTKQKFI